MNTFIVTLNNNPVTAVDDDPSIACSIDERTDTLVELTNA